MPASVPSTHGVGFGGVEIFSICVIAIVFVMGSSLVNSTMDVVMTGRAFKMRKRYVSKTLVAYLDPTQLVG